MTLPTYDEAFARARQRSAFANGTEGDAWLEANCERCLHDKPTREGRPQDGCPLIMVAYEGRTPAEWLDGSRDEQGRYGMADQYTCVLFRPEDEPGADEPAPIPDLPDQEVLFPRDEYVRPARMYADTKPVEVTA